jgi:hypothetical protein
MSLDQRRNRILTEHNSDGTHRFWDGHRIFYSSGIPSSTSPYSTQTWAVGDRAYNSVPSAGNPKSWVCTTAGTPGTWTSEGNL